MNGQLMPRRAPAKSGTEVTAQTPVSVHNVTVSPASDETPRPSVLMIGSEALPFSKTGGLADVLGALPQALAQLGWDVTLAIPRYRESRTGTLIDRFELRIGGVTADIGVFEAPLGPARALLVDEPSLYDRDHLYATETGDYPDNARRFAVLVRAALEFAIRRGARPTIVHAHDWQAGLAPVYLKTLFASHPVLGGVASVFTIHNMAYQGLFQPDWLPRLDLQWSLLGIEQLEYWGKISFLKGGINYADVITTVSPQYAKEIQTPAFGAGFDPKSLRATSSFHVPTVDFFKAFVWANALEAPKARRRTGRTHMAVNLEWRVNTVRKRVLLLIRTSCVARSCARSGRL